MKFDLPKGAVVLANLTGVDGDGKRTKRAWRRCTVIDMAEKVKRRGGYYSSGAAFETQHAFMVDVVDRQGQLTVVQFASARIDSPVLDHSGAIVTKRFKLKDAAQEIYSARSLWWSKGDFNERAATVLEVWMYESRFVPYAGWRLVDVDDGIDVRSEPFEERIWRAPIKLTRSVAEAEAEYFDEKRLAEIKRFEALYEDAKQQARDFSTMATKYRLKLATLKRMR